MNYAANRLFKLVRKQFLSRRAARILVAVSGGPDSVALLHVLHGLRTECDLHLEVAHVQHGIRGEDAKADARFVGALAEKLGLPFHLEEIDLPELRSRAGKGNLEAMAREQRYRYFVDIARRRRLSEIATAHSQDDQAETLLMHLLRGAGRKGLGGMSPASVVEWPRDSFDQDLQITRPFLEISKAEILRYLHERQLEFCVDSTNRDIKLLRNWIRLELLPQLRLRFDGRVSARLAAQAALLRDDQAVLDHVVQSELANCRRGDGLDRILLLKQPPALQRLLLRCWIMNRRGNLRGIALAHVEALRELAATGPAQGRLAIPGGWEARREYDALHLKKGKPQPQAGCYLYALKLGERLRIREANIELISKTSPAPVGALCGDLSEAAFDLDALPEPLVVRNFRQGDRFQPLGMSGHKKVNELFIDRKITLAERAKLPMLIGNGEILWIPGHGRSQIALATPQSRVVVRIKLVPLGT